MNYKLIVLQLFLALSHFIVFGQNDSRKKNVFEQQAVNNYQVRYIQTKKSIQTLKSLLSTAKNSDEKIIASALLTLCFIKEKDIKSANHFIQIAKKELPATTNKASLGYYHFALFRYKYYIDQDGFLTDLMHAYTDFEKTNNHYFACLAACSVFNLSANPAFNFLKKAQQHAAQINNPDCTLEVALCQSSYYKEKYNKQPSDVLKSKAIQAFEQCIAYQNEASVYNQFNVAVAFLNYANFLVGINEQSAKALHLLDVSLKIAKKHTIMSVYRNSYGIKGLLLMNQGKLAAAEQHFQTGLAQLKAMPYNDPAVAKMFNENLKQIAALQKNYVAYYQYDKNYQDAASKNDVLELEESVQNAIAKYELNNKEKTIRLLTEQNKLKNWLLISVGGLVLLIASVFFFFLQSVRIKQKLIQQKKQETQKELMSSILHLERKNEILSTLKTTLMQQNRETPATIPSQIFKTIDIGLSTDDDYEKFQADFSKIYPEFFVRLQQKAANSLTQLDLKYCGFILMKLSNKEIASQMNVEPKSIRMARYRIKQKLQLSKDEDLDVFIQNAAE